MVLAPDMCYIHIHGRAAAPNSAAVVLDDGSVVIGGYTDGDWDGGTSTNGDRDFAAERITPDGQLD